MAITNEHQSSDSLIFEELTAIFRDVFEDETIVLRAETSGADIAGWDSFNNTTLIAAIEQKFSIRFRTAELRSLHNVGSFVKLIRGKLQGRS